MRNPLPSLICVLVAFIYLVTACPDIRPPEDFDVQRMEGKWYLTGFATNMEWLNTARTFLKIGIMRAVPTAEGDLDIYNSNMRSSGYCWRLNHRAHRTETPGRFYFVSRIWKNENDVRIVDVDYDEYAMFYAIKAEYGIEEPLTMLFSRTPNPSFEVQEKFEQLCRETGILDKNMLFLQKNEECPDVRTYLTI